MPPRGRDVGGTFERGLPDRPPRGPVGTLEEPVEHLLARRKEVRPHAHPSATPGPGTGTPSLPTRPLLRLCGSNTRRVCHSTRGGQRGQAPERPVSGLSCAALDVGPGNV